MDLSEISTSLRQLWEYKPWTIILVVLGFVGSLFLVVDTRRHRRKRKRPR